MFRTRAICCLAAVVALVVTTAWPQVPTGVIVADGASAGMNLGVSVAADGNLAVLGGHDVYLFAYDGVHWVQRTELLQTDPIAGDQFGRWVAVSCDTIVVGARLHAGGVVYVYERPRSGWPSVMTETARLTATDSVGDDQFGGHVAIDRDVIVAGAHRDDVDGDMDAGSAYVFVKSAVTWTDMTETAKLTASNGAADDRLGIRVGVSGSTVVVGAHLQNQQTGSVYVYEEPTGGWISATEDARLLASDGRPGDELGYSVSIRDDTVLVGAWGGEFGVNLGAAYVFERPMAGWTGDISEVAKLTASDGEAGDLFGRQVALSGGIALVGVPWDDDVHSESGSIYAYRKPASGWVSADQSCKIANPNPASGDEFSSVAMSGDNAILGAWSDDTNGSNAGLAYGFNVRRCCAANFKGGPNGDVDDLVGIEEFLAVLASWGQCGS